MHIPDIQLKLNFVPTGIPMLIIISWSLAKYLHQDEGYVHKHWKISFRVGYSWELHSFKLSLISRGTFFVYTNLLWTTTKDYLLYLYYVREAILNQHESAWEHTICCVCVLSDAGRQEIMAGYGGYCEFQSLFLSQ